MHGEDDRLVPLDGTTTGWSSLAGRGSSSKTYPEARHEIFNETNRDEVLGDVVDFVGTHIHPLETLED